MSKIRVLTGVKPTGMPHVGNYLGAIKPAILASKEDNTETFLFMANYHSLNTVYKGDELREMTYQVAATWLALGVDPTSSVFFRQSDIPEVLELHWILSCFTSKGLMNRAHAYKAQVDANIAKGSDPDNGINIGLYTYPVLMSADILAFKTDFVPVGQDQVQHIEMARDIAKDINSNYKKELFKLPKAKIQDDVAIIPGLDGRKMSKSYNNTIPLFIPENKLRKLIMRIVTDSSAPTDPKDPDQSFLFSLYKHFASASDISTMRERYLKGISWGEAKEALFVVLNEEIKGPRTQYEELLSDKGELERILLSGKDRAREVAGNFLSEIKTVIGC